MTAPRRVRSAYVSSNYFLTHGTNVNPVNKYSVKGDHIFNQKFRISGYYGYDHEDTLCGADGCPTLPGNYTTYNASESCSIAFIAGSSTGPSAPPS